MKLTSRFFSQEVFVSVSTLHDMITIKQCVVPFYCLKLDVLPIKKGAR